MTLGRVTTALRGDDDLTELPVVAEIVLGQMELTSVILLLFLHFESYTPIGSFIARRYEATL